MDVMHNCNALSSSVLLHIFSVPCVYSMFEHHLHPPGYLCEKFHFFCGLHCWASPCRKIAHSITQSYLMPWEPKLSLWNNSFTKQTVKKLCCKTGHSSSIWFTAKEVCNLHYWLVIAWQQVGMRWSKVIKSESVNDYCTVLEKWVSEKVGLTSHSTHNRSVGRQVFPGNQLHWYWQPETRKHNNTYRQRNVPGLTKQTKPRFGMLLDRKWSWPNSRNRRAYTGLMVETIILCRTCQQLDRQQITTVLCTSYNMMITPIWPVSWILGLPQLWHIQL